MKLNNKKYFPGNNYGKYFYYYLIYIESLFYAYYLIQYFRKR